jgi:arylsulfatase A-like enzyme/cytochrome c-type biogenesis protein CcmH/NrfG
MFLVRRLLVAFGVAGAIAIPFALAAASGGCGGSLPERRPNVLLVTIDTLRADRLGAYGYDAAETPALDALASEGILFETVVAPSPLTLPSHASLLTSMSPPVHGLRDNAPYEMNARARLLSEVLQEAGYETAAFVGAYVLHSRFGLARGFDAYDDVFRYGELGGAIAERRGEDVVQSARAWLESRAGSATPFFAWVHLYDPHDPYEPPEPFRARFAERPYDGEVAYVDGLVQQLLDAVASEETIVVVTADHGEGLGEHGEPTHGLFVYDPTLLVPLLMRVPGSELSGVEVTDQVRLIDVAPTILELVGVSIPDVFEGQSLLDIARGLGYETLSLPAYSETLAPRLYFGWSELRSLRRDGYKLILAPRPELYRLADDPRETRNVLDDEPARARAMAAELEKLAMEGAVVETGEMSTDEQEALLSLGYLGGGARAVTVTATDADASELSDPKDKVDLFRRYNSGNNLLNEGRSVEAERELAAVVEEDPAMAMAWFALGRARLAQQDYSGARDALRTALERNPEYTLTRISLGLAELGAGDRAAARTIFEAVLSEDPNDANAHLQLGEMELEEERPRQALAHFERALSGHDRTPSLHLMSGVAYLQLDELEKAESALERAAALDPHHPRVHFYLALVAESRGDHERAIERYREEVGAHPDHFESWFNLSLKLGEVGDVAGAIVALRATVEAQPDLAVGHVYLARALLSTNDPDVVAEAEAAARRGLALDPVPELRALGEETLAEIGRRRRR